MTDYTKTQPIELTDTELINIRTFGQAADAEITAAQVAGAPPPVGVWKAMYEYIFGLISPTFPTYALQAPYAQQYWFEQAQYITADNENVPSGYFVRDVTAIGMNVSGSQRALSLIEGGWVALHSHCLVIAWNVEIPYTGLQEANQCQHLQYRANEFAPLFLAEHGVSA